MHPPLTPFPVLDEIGHEPWEWPLPGFISLHVVVPRCDSEQPCLIETLAGTTTEGQIVRIDPGQRTVRFRMSADGPPLALPFDRFRRLTLTTPLTAVPRPIGVPVWRVPAAEEERAYRLTTPAGGPPLAGITLGHVETEHGLFLFTPVNEDRSVQRAFVPRSAYTQAEFGPTAVDTAAERWIASPSELVAALERQSHMPVLPLGDSLLQLGLLTRGQLSRALAARDDRRPLGERLVSEGLLSAADLQTALAHKMGYPIVDLTRFPVDPAAARRLPMARVAELRALPLMWHDGRLVVAVDRLSRVNRLREHRAQLQLDFLPCLASQRQIQLAFAALVKQDLWSPNERVPHGVFNTTL
ncbi:hypothetical protein [Ideonella sp. BN130291]|uniref:GspE/PulE/PilB domain-containing protein n=1 Tax=Ideonella sp. BN130291 TaxID=3112940 RepID=UPI002E2544DB|nr:hypothetical protein [Ideonella sp. BN130291]